MKTNSLRSAVKRLVMSAQPRVGKVDIAAALNEARERHRLGIPTPPMTPEQIESLQRTPLGRALLAARKRVGIL